MSLEIVSQSASVGNTIIGKTADLTVVQKMIFETLPKEGDRRKAIAKEAGCPQSAVCSIGSPIFLL